MQLLEQKPDVGHYRFFQVRDPKPRKICAASFPERVLHHAIMNYCEPVLDKYAIFDSYACRKNKGVRKALARAGYFAERYRFYLKLDIKKYFDSIDQKTVIKLFNRLFKDKLLIDLFQKILNTYNTKPGKGLPIGNLVSQHLANFYLGRFDHWVKEDIKCRGYIRYMDDFILFDDNIKQLKQHLRGINIFLSEELSLTLKENIQLNRCCKGTGFLGYRIYPFYTLLSKQSKTRFVRKFNL